MVVTWMVRLIAGVFCVMLLLMAMGNAQTGSTSFWWVVVDDVIPASLVFLVFASAVVTPADCHESGELQSGIGPVRVQIRTP